MLSQYSLLHIHALTRPRCTNTIKREQNKAEVSFLYKLIEVNERDLLLIQKKRGRNSRHDVTYLRRMRS